MFRVLIAEDELLVRIGLKNSINWNSFHMTVIADVADGQAAWDIYQAEKPELIITDLKMPILDGMELISKVRENDNSTQFIILSCLEDFSLARKAMALGVKHYILKLDMTIKDMERILASIRDELELQKPKNAIHENTTTREALKENLLRNFVLYHLYTIDDFIEQAKDLHLRVKPEHLVACILDISHYNTLISNQVDNHRQLIKVSLSNMLHKFVDEFGKGEVFFDEENRYLFLFNLDNTAEQPEGYDEIIQFLNKVSQSLFVYYNVAVSFGLGSCQNGYDKLDILFGQADHASQNRFYFGCGNYIFGHQYDKVDSVRNKCNSLYDLGGIVRKRDDAFHREYRERIDSLTEHMLKDNDRTKIQEDFCSLVQWIPKALQLSSGTCLDPVIASCDCIRKAEHLDDIIQILRDFFFSLISNLNKKRGLSNEVSVMLEFMQANYSKNIVMQDIAELVGLSSNYIGSLFKKEMQASFSEYLSEIRIENAKRLLLETNFKAYEIAEKVGFNDNTYFTRIFKKHVGLSPSDFRKQWIRNWNEEDHDNEEKSAH